MKNTNMVFGCLLLLISILVSGAASGGGRTTEVVIRIAPSVLHMDKDQGGEVTVHAGIPLGEVDTSSITLSGIPALHTKADARGNLVAKFNEDEVKAAISPPEATLTLTGLTVDDNPLEGSARVVVRD